MSEGLYNAEGDWSEDFKHENGCYAHQCAKCDTLFTGHKRRPDICKKCYIKELNRESTVNALAITGLKAINNRYREALEKIRGCQGEDEWIYLTAKEALENE